MKKSKLFKLAVVIGAIAFLIVGTHIALSGPKRDAERAKNSFANIAYAGINTSVTPAATPANPGGVPGMPGGPSDGTLPNPDGKTTQAAIPVSDSDIAMSPSIGMPAIRPNNSAAGPTGPAFTLDDVTRYYRWLYPQKNLNSYGAAGYQSIVPTSLVRAEFLTKKDLDARVTFDLNLPDDTLLCFVQYSGSFILRSYPVNGPFTGATARFTPSTAPYAVEVYDAHTGNVLLWGTNPSLK